MVDISYVQLCFTVALLTEAMLLSTHIEYFAYYKLTRLAPKGSLPCMRKGHSVQGSCLLCNRLLELFTIYRPLKLNYLYNDIQRFPMDLVILDKSQ